MNYINNYLNYLTGSNRKEIYKIFCGFLECLRTDNFNQLHLYITENCLADFSTVGHMKGVHEIKEKLSWPGPKLDIAKITIWNFASRSKNDRAVQSAYVQCIFAVEDEENVYPFIFGGHFCNDYLKEGNEWKISHIKFDLMYEEGNNSFVRNNWRLMDYGIFCGHTPVISPEFDSPWMAIPVDDEPMSDAEQIFDLQFKKTFGIDSGNFQLVESTFTDDIYFDFSSHKNNNKYNPTQTDGDYVGKKDVLNFLKAKQHKEARLQHTDCLIDLVFDNDNEATAYMFRSEFHRTKNRIYNKQNIHSNVNTAIHKMQVRKENGEWKICRLGYYPVLEFTSVDDDCLQYDEFICGGTRWKEIIKGL